jgi:membrane protease YdiL (CAAX protease family)
MLKKVLPFLKALLAFGLNIAVGWADINLLLPLLRTDISQVRANETVQSVLLICLFAAINIAVALVMFRLLDRRPWKEFGLGVTPRGLLLTVLGIAFYVVGWMVIVSVTKSAGVINWIPARKFTPIFFFFEAVGYGVGAGLYEEFLYRGYIFNTLKDYGRVPAYIISMILFSVVHFTQPGDPFNWMRLTGLLSATVALTYIYDRTRSIWPAVLVHGAFDYITIMFIGMKPGFSLYTWALMPGKWFNFNWSNILLNLPLVLIVFLVYLRRKPSASLPA